MASCGKVVTTMEEERDVVVFSDDEGNEFELEVIDYFDHEDQEYAVLMDTEDCDCEDEECEHETEVYIMKVVVNGEMEEFLPADEDKMEELIKIVEDRIASWDDEDDECGCDDCCDCDDDVTYEITCPNCETPPKTHANGSWQYFE